MIGYEELKLAWDWSYPGLSKPNTLCTVRMNGNKTVYEITKEALAKKTTIVQIPKMKFVAVRGKGNRSLNFNHSSACFYYRRRF